METRGNPVAMSISRRSCDQCRSRKIGCDRGSPCSNCTTGRIECTHSARAVKETPPKQRVLISSQYEQKIDDIARDVSVIKSRLQDPGNSAAPRITSPNSQSSRPLAKTAPVAERVQLHSDAQPERTTKRRRIDPLAVDPSSWDHAVQIVDFVKSVADSNSSSDDGLSSSLKGLVQAMLSPRVDSQIPSLASHAESSPIPPLEAVLPLLRWVKTHQNFHRVQWMNQVLPIPMFEDICRKVYFAVDDYTLPDYILALGFLSYMFSEHKVSTGSEKSAHHGEMCRKAFAEALSKLPIILPSNIETIAALLLATLFSVESSRSANAWTYISSAANHCQTLRLHRFQSPHSSDMSLGNNLFLSVYKFEKGLSLRLGRSSSIRDAEVELPLALSRSPSTKIARIQGQIYDQLYSYGGLTDPIQRGALADSLGAEVKDVIKGIETELSSIKADEEDVMRELYVRADLVCHTSILTSILRAVPPALEQPNGTSQYLVAAREVFRLHEECMARVHKCNDTPTMTRYLNWSILHTPFVPFSILFAQVVQTFDQQDLDRLRRFAESLKPTDSSNGKASATHPYRLYELLYRTAQRYVEYSQQTRTVGSSSGSTLVDSLGTPNESRGSELVNDLGDFDPMLGQFDTSALGFEDWFQGNQQLFRLLDEDAPF